MLLDTINSYSLDLLWLVVITQSNGFIPASGATQHWQTHLNSHLPLCLTHSSPFSKPTSYIYIIPSYTIACHHHTQGNVAISQRTRPSLVLLNRIALIFFDLLPVYMLCRSLTCTSGMFFVSYGDIFILLITLICIYIHVFEHSIELINTGLLIELDQWYDQTKSVL